MQNLLNWTILLGTLIGAGALLGCASMSHSAGEISKQPFGTTKEGTAVDLYTLRNSKGVEAKISNYGGLVLSLHNPDPNRQIAHPGLGDQKPAGVLQETA